MERMLVNAEASGVSDTTALSALAAVASGLAISIGPFGVGIVADRVGLRSALLLVPALTTVGVVACVRRSGEEAGLTGQTGPVPEQPLAA